MSRQETIRQALHDHLRRGPATPRQLSAAVGISEKDVPQHLEHLRRSLVHTGETLRIEPSTCRDCGFVFKKRERLTRPGRCPECKGTHIEPPAYTVEHA